MIETLPSRRATLSEADIDRLPELVPWTHGRSGTLSESDIRVAFTNETTVTPFRPPGRLQAVWSRLEQLVSLPSNWDSYGAPVIDMAVAEAVGWFLEDLAREEIELPSVTPTSRGGVALEWHRPGLEFAFELEPSRRVEPPRVRVFFADDASGEEWEEDVAIADASRIQEAFSRLTSVHAEG